jgi:cytochrome P450
MDPEALHRWTMAISNYTFSGDNPPVNLDIAARAGGRLMDKELDAAITGTPGAALPGDTFLRRLAGMGGAEAMSHDQIRATIAGLLSGFLPNLPAAGYNVLQILLERPQAMRIAREAALADDDDLLERCIKEALRLRPLDPGRRRLCVNQNAPGIPAPGWFGRLFPAPRKVYANTLLAMSDSQRIRKPNRFDPDRPASDNLAFGLGKHYCVGAPFALCLLVQALKPLLRKPGLRRSRGARASFLFLQFFPRNLELSFDVARP